MATIIGTATLVLRGLPGYRGQANLYRVDPPLEGHDHVIVTTVPSYRSHGPRTAIHAADGSSAWLPGSDTNTFGHIAALIRAGYTRITERSLAPRCTCCGLTSGTLDEIRPEELLWLCQEEDCGALFTSDRDGFSGVLRKARRRAARLEAAPVGHFA